MTKQAKLAARERQALILAAALRLAEQFGYTRVTREAIGMEAVIAPALVSYHFGTMPDLRRAIMREAVRAECLPVIAQGIALRDRHALRASEELRARVMAWMAEGKHA